MKRTLIITSVGGVAIAIGISILSYFKYKDIQKWRAEEECIPYPIAINND